MSDLIAVPKHKVDSLAEKLTTAQAEIEALRDRLENYEALKRMHRLDNYPNELSAKAWLLRKQAEAVDWAWHKYCRESASEDCKVLYQGDMEDAVKALRQQADEAERAGGEK